MGAQPMQIQRITVKEGLSQSSPYHIFKDSRGFLWLGTQDGVNRYDGHHFRIYKPDGDNPFSLRGVNIAGIVEDKNGDIWVGSEEGLNSYDRATDRFFLIKTSPQKRRTSPFYADDKEIWFSSEGQGLMVYDYKSQQLKKLGTYAYISREFDFVDWTVRTSFGDVWMLGPKGVVRFEIKNQKYHYYFTNTPRCEYGPALNVYSLSVDSQNIVWLGTDQGLVRFDHLHKSHELHPCPTPNEVPAVIASLAHGLNGQLWIGTLKQGLWIFDKIKRKYTEVQYRPNSSESLKNYEIYRIYVDNTGIVWANSDPDGLVKIIPNASMFGFLGRPDFSPPERRLSDLSIRCLGEDARGIVWIGTENGLDLYDPKRGIITERYFANEGNILKYIFKDSRQRMWVGTYGGVMLFDASTKTFTKYLFDHDPRTRTHVRNMLELPNGKLLLGTRLGMWSFDPATTHFEKVPILADRNIFATYLDAEGTLWVGSYFDRLYGFRLSADGKWEKRYEGLTEFNINSIREDTLQGLLWIATEKGLVAFRKDNQAYRLYNEKDGLANTYIYGVLLAPEGNIFMSTNHGLSCLEVETGVIRNFDLSDGLQGYEYNGNAFFKTASGQCFFGGIKGLNYFYPRQFRKLSYSPRVHFYNLRVNEEPYQSEGYIDERALLRLQHDQNTFSLDFACIDYYSNGKNYYKYLLEGQDQGWVNAGDRTYVRYANLAPGRYVLRVKAANRDGAWNGPERKLYVVIRPPFWRTWWFSAFYLLTVTGGSYLLIQQRLRNLNRRQKERLKIALEAQEQERKNIAQDLHDEVGSRLATLKLYLSSLTGHLKPSKEAERIKQQVLEIINVSLIDIRRLLRELSPRTLEQYGYAAAVEELTHKINTSEQIHVAFEARRLPEQLPTDIATGLYRITQELLNNTLKHANATEVTISVIPSGNVISFFYSDNGDGFDYAKARNGLGIGNIKSRVAVLGGQIDWFTAAGKGLEVTIEIPLSNS